MDTIFICPFCHRPFALKDGHAVDLARWAPFDENQLVTSKLVVCVGCLPAGVYDTEPAESLLSKAKGNKIVVPQRALYR